MSAQQRNHSFIDQLIKGVDNGLRTLISGPAHKNEASNRPSPAADRPENSLTPAQRKHVAGLMRVDHTGEVCAQALYQGQALTARLDEVRYKMEQAAEEENDHLAWCASRIEELDSFKSYLDPLWYAGSFMMGATAGLIGDKWSLGFVAETEKQVVRHLETHLAELPAQDEKSRAILEQMKEDEGQHAMTAVAAGAADLPAPITVAMGLMSKVMTTVAYHI